MIDCGAVACALVTLSCTGKVLTYTPDLSRQVEVRQPFDFNVVLDLSLGRLAGAPVADVESFELRDAGDAVFFIRDRAIGARKVFEWISISRISGNYAHFIAFRDPVSGSLESSILMASGNCKEAT